MREEGEEQPAGVLIVQIDGAPAGAPRRRRRRRSRPRTAEALTPPGPVPVTRLTAVRTEPFADSEVARRWLREVGGDADRRDAEIAAAIAVANRALYARSLAAADPAGVQLGRSSAIAVRIGFGSGDEVAAGRWTEAVEVPADEGRVRRVDALRPTERVAAILGARDRPLACETLILRARSDLDAGRDREAALQLRPGVEAMLAELGRAALAEQRGDLDKLAEHRDGVDAAAEAALSSDLTEEERVIVGDVLALAERVLRRRRILG